MGAGPCSRACLDEEYVSVSACTGLSQVSFMRATCKASFMDVFCCHWFKILNNFLERALNSQSSTQNELSSLCSTNCIASPGHLEGQVIRKEKLAG